MLEAAFWGLIQGLTEFLPISSSGHLVLVPAVFGLDEPGLATTAVLHLGTLAAVLWYYRDDLLRIIRSPGAPESRRILWLLLLGTIPAAVIGLSLEGPIEIIFSEPWLAAVMLMVTGAVLSLSLLIPRGTRRVEDGRAGDAAVVGFAQAFALIPGISRSGMTITAGMAQGLQRVEAARYAFLLAIPSIAGAGFLEGLELVRQGGFEASMLLGVAVAAVTGYFSIAFLLRLLTRVGMAPFAVYCLVVGAVCYLIV